MYNFHQFVVSFSKLIYKQGRQKGTWMENQARNRNYPFIYLPRKDTTASYMTPLGWQLDVTSTCLRFPVLRSKGCKPDVYGLYVGKDVRRKFYTILLNHFSTIYVGCNSGNRKSGWFRRGGSLKHNTNISILRSDDLLKAARRKDLWTTAFTKYLNVFSVQCALIHGEDIS